MHTVQTLIRDAIDTAGGKTKLAARIGMAPTHLSNILSGKDPLSPATVGLLCDVVGLDPEEARALAVQVIVDGAKAPAKKAALRRAFFVGATWGGVALATAIAAISPSDAQARNADAPYTSGASGFTLYIMSTLRRAGATLRRVVSATRIWGIYGGAV